MRFIWYFKFDIKPYNNLVLIITVLNVPKNKYFLKISRINSFFFFIVCVVNNITDNIGDRNFFLNINDFADKFSKILWNMFIEGRYTNDL